MICQFGGGVVRRHHAVVRALASIIHQVSLARVAIEKRSATLDRQAANGNVQEGQMDIIVMNLDGCVQYIDVAIVSPVIANANLLANAGRRDGYAARRAENKKKQRYQVRNLVPFVIELGGRPGNLARKFVSSLFDDEDPGKAIGISRVWSTLSCVMNSAISEQLSVSEV